MSGTGVSKMHQRFCQTKERRRQEKKSVHHEENPRTERGLLRDTENKEKFFEFPPGNIVAVTREDIVIRGRSTSWLPPTKKRRCKNTFHV